MKRAAAVLATALAVWQPQLAEAQLQRVDPRCDYTVWIVSTMDIFRPDATDCAGAFSGNDTNQLADVRDEIISQGWGTSTDYLGSTDDAHDGPFSNDPSWIVGTLHFDNPLTGDYVVSLKAANQFSLYFFAGLVDQTSLFYTTLGTAQNGHGWPKDLSHASLWSVGGSTVSVPEPGSVALLLAGMVGLGFAASRRRRSPSA
jgi:hypothetical protein